MIAVLIMILYENTKGKSNPIRFLGWGNWD